MGNFISISLRTSYPTISNGFFIIGFKPRIKLIYYIKEEMKRLSKTCSSGKDFNEVWFVYVLDSCTHDFSQNGQKVGPILPHNIKEAQRKVILAYELKAFCHFSAEFCPFCFFYPIFGRIFIIVLHF